MRNPFKKRGDTPIVVMPTPVQVDWQKYHAMNQKRMARGAEPIPADEWERTVQEASKPKQYMTREAVEATQVWLYKHNREPLTAREILELTGVNMSDIKTDFAQIESDYQAELAKAQADIQRMAELGFQVPPDAMTKARAKADERHDQAIAAQREVVLQSAALLREGHAPLRWQARLNATVPVDDLKAQQMAAILAGAKSIADLKRLHAEALAGMNPDEAGAYYLETHGIEHLASLPHDELTLKGHEHEWRQVAEAQRIRRAGAPLQTILRDEADLQAALEVVNAHPTTFEHTSMAQTLGVKPEHMPVTSAQLRLPPPEPVFD